MESKEYLNEEKYQKTKKKITKISLIILIVGVLIGVCFIVAGVVTQNNVKKTNEERYNAAYKKSEENIAKANERLEKIKNEKDELTAQYNAKQQECDSLNMSDSDWFTKSNQCNREASAINEQIRGLDTEKFELENNDFEETYVPILSIKYLIFYYIGAVIIGGSCLIAGIFYLVAKGREIKAFTIQQTTPIAQEGIQKIAPTIGNSAGVIGQNIVEGITTGVNNANNNGNNVVSNDNNVINNDNKK